MSENILAFSPFRLDLADTSLWRDDRRVPLTFKDFAVLSYLATHSDQLVTHKELLQAVWPDVTVTQGVLKVCLRRIRQALGDSATAPQFIETRHRQGCRFIGKVVSGPHSVVSSQEQSSVQGLTSEVKNFHSTFSTPQSAIPLVGRDPELRQLHQWLDQALQGKRQIVFITGEPGIGKSAIARAFLRQIAASGIAAVGRGQCVETCGPGEAYLPILEALGRLCRAPGRDTLIEQLRQHAPTWLVQMPTLLTAAEAETLRQKLQGFTQARMLQEMLTTVETLTPERPLVLIIEISSGAIIRRLICLPLWPVVTNLPGFYSSVRIVQEKCWVVVIH
jgi:DNA-binding winged helix-turn-helix (wHTH) protein